MMGSVSSKKQIDGPVTISHAAVRFLTPLPPKDGDSRPPSQQRKRARSNTPRLSLWEGGDNRKYSEGRSLMLINSANAEGIRQMLHGNPNFGYASKVKIVRIFTSSTFTDTFHERNYLMEKVFPRLKDYCQKFGYEFQVVDMRWGVREDAENDHTTTELCMKELEACQKLSTGPNFVSFMSHKYGYRPFPRTINADDFDILTDEVTEEEEELINRWFLLDENLVPPAYVLQPISSQIPDFLSEDDKKRKTAKDTWWQVFLKLQNVLIRGAKENFKADKRHNYMMSVTERELKAGILDAKDANKHCLWFHRRFQDIEGSQQAGKLSKYYEFKSIDSLSIEEVQTQIHNLRDVQMREKLPSKNIHQYNIHWQAQGVDPKVSEHSAYLDELCDDFYSSMQQMIKAGVEEALNEEGPDATVGEILEHSAFRHQTCQLFSGRQAMLKLLEKYVCGSSNQPLILVGGSGCGKTAIMAMASTQAWQWQGGTGVIVTRFIGFTKLSLSIKCLLQTINKQLYLIYDRPISAKCYKSEDMKTITQGFSRLLRKASKEKPILLILDSLDNLETSDGGRQLEWLPRELPANVKVILSMRPEEKYGVFPRCKTIFVKESCYQGVPALDLHEVGDIIECFLTQKNRWLPPQQRQVLVEGYKRSPSPLYLKVALDESLRWRSFDPLDVTVLYSSVPAMINAFFKRIERKHGQVLVSFALAYFTVAQSGLSETEMEDLLSLNDTVLNDVYQYWVPPVRRLPPLLWVRIKSDLDPYLGKRDSEGVQLIIWVYEEFFTTCVKRYLSNEMSKTICQSILSDYFLGEWADKPKPYKDKDTIKEALRYVAKQPLRFDNGQYNLRKLNQLPYHLIAAGKLDVLKKEVLCNYEFLLAKISAVGISSVLKDFKSAHCTFPKDEEVSIVLEALQLSQFSLEMRPLELSGQLIGRLHINSSSNELILDRAQEMLINNQLDAENAPIVQTLKEMLEKLMEYQKAKYSSLMALLSQARGSSSPALAPHTACLVKPGGQLLHNISDHYDRVNVLEATSNGKTFVTGADDNTVKVWDIESGEMLMSCQVNSDVIYLSVFPGDTKLVASTVLGTVYIIDITMGTIILERDHIGGNVQTTRPLTVCQIPKGPNVIAVLVDKQLLSLCEESLTLHGSCDNKLDLDNHGTGKPLIIKSDKNQVVYASPDANDIFVCAVQKKNSLVVEQFPIFEMPEKVSSRKTLISTISLIPGKNKVIVCSGQTQEIRIFDLHARKVVASFGGHPRDRIKDIYFAKSENILYFTHRTDVGFFNLSNGDREIQFPHPCKVVKIVACGTQHVVTLAEDNILRIWDKSMKPFTPDVSIFSGKVAVNSKSSMKTFKSIIGTFSEEFNQSLQENEAMLTTEDVPNYWTPDSDEMLCADEISYRFFPMPNARHLVVTHDSFDMDNSQKRYTQCVTLWDLVKMQCVCRFFPSGYSMYIQGVLSDQQLVFSDRGDEGSPLYALDISGEIFKPSVIYSGISKLKLGCDVRVVPGTKCIVGENSEGELTIFDADKNEEKVLQPKTKPNGNGLRYNKIWVLPDGRHVMALLALRYLCKWSVQNTTLLWEVDLNVHTVTSMSPQDGSTHPHIAIDWTVDLKFVVVTADSPQSADEKKVAKSVAVFDLESGAYKSSQNVLPSTNHVYKLPMLRFGKEKSLQLTGLDVSGTAHLLHEVSLSKYIDRLLVAETGNRCVTWCSRAKEQTITYWSYDGDKMQSLGSFTLDDELQEVYLTNSGQSIITNTATGLVRLEMCGRNVAGTQSALKNLPVLYEEPDLNVKFDVES